MVMNRSMDALNEQAVSFDVHELQHSYKSVLHEGLRIKPQLEKNRNRYENSKSSEAHTDAVFKSQEKLRS